jgi:hypothetical protein
MTRAAWPQSNFRNGFPRPFSGTLEDMPLLLLSIPLTVLLLAGVLFLSGVVEQRFLSPRAVVLSTVRARRSTPEYAEAVVARQFEDVLKRMR